MKNYYFICYQFINGFGKAEIKNTAIDISPMIWLKTKSPKSTIITSIIQMPEDDYIIYNG